jgi:ribosomal protein L7/L12
MENDDLVSGLNDVQKIILERIKKNITGLTVKEAKDVLYKALNDMDNEVILNYPSSTK